VFLALREIRRSKVRFGLLIAAVALLAFLILFQSAIQNSLIRQFVGGVRHQTAPVLVFNVDGRRFPQSSSVSPELEEKVRATEGIGGIAAIYQGTFPIEAGGETQATSVLGYTDPDLGGPGPLLEGRLPEAAGEVVANAGNEEDGFGIGSTVTVQPAGIDLEVVGLADDVGINVLPTVFTTSDTYLTVLQTRNPAATLDVPNVLGVSPASGTTVAELTTRLNRADESIDALSRVDAAELNPGIESIKQSFTVILVLFGLVVPLVCGLFFLILTFQKASSLVLLRALGAPARRLVEALLVQVSLVLGVGLGIAVGGFALLTRGKTGSLRLRFEPTNVGFWVATLVVLGVVSAVASIRRVLAIDPNQATGGGGAGR
jgi:putative ABC transport system permease protein